MKLKKTMLERLVKKLGIPELARRVCVRESTIYRWLATVNPHNIFKKRLVEMYFEEFPEEKKNEKV